LHYTCSFSPAKHFGVIPTYAPLFLFPGDNLYERIPSRVSYSQIDTLRIWFSPPLLSPRADGVYGSLLSFFLISLKHASLALLKSFCCTPPLQQPPPPSSPSNSGAFIVQRERHPFFNPAMDFFFFSGMRACAKPPVFFSQGGCYC